MHDYKAALARAIERTHKWGLTSVGSIMAEQYLAHDLGDMVKPSADALAEVSRTLPFPPLQRPGACASIHLLALAMFYEDHLGAPPVLTIGDVRIDGKPRFNVTRQGLRKLVREGPERDGVINLHMWLTWGEFSILDLTLMPSVLHAAGVDPRLDRPDGLVLLGKPAELKPTFSFHPWLVGAEFSRRIGAVQPMAQAHFDDRQAMWRRWQANEVEARLGSK